MVQVHSSTPKALCSTQGFYNIYTYKEVLDLADNFNQYDWHDSIIQKIEIRDSSVNLLISLDDANSTSVSVKCSAVVGITNICMWEDNIINCVNINTVSDFSNPFLSEIRANHPVYDNEINAPVRKGLLDLSITLANNITFHIYCYNVDIE